MVPHCILDLMFVEQYLSQVFETMAPADGRWEDNIKMDLQVQSCRGVDWIYLAQDRDSWLAVVSAVMNIWVS
jgi:hypothetical protein